MWQERNKVPKFASNLTAWLPVKKTHVMNQHINIGMDYQSTNVGYQGIW